MELFQSSLLQYWQFEPVKEGEEDKKDIGKAEMGEPEKPKPRKVDDQGEAQDDSAPPAKRIPVFFMDESHKLAALIQVCCIAD